MGQYKTRSVFVEAEQWFPTEWHRNHLGKDSLGVLYLSDERGELETPDGPVEVSPGDWIVTTWGHRACLKDEWFKLKYEPVE